MAWTPVNLLVSMRALSLVPMCSIVVSVSLGGQAVRGRIVLPDSTTPAAGIVVTAIGANGKPAANALSAASGDYVIRLPAPGRYELRVLRIGFRPTVLTGIVVTADSVRMLNIVLDRLPVVLSGIVVRDRADCDLAGREADTFVQLWEQARGALTAARLSDQSSSLDVHLVRIEGRVDAMRYYSPETVGLPLPEMDTLTVREWVSDRVFATTPAETLETSGYVRRRSTGDVVYDAPGAEALLADGFLQTHCFSVVGAPRGHPEWIGIAFIPRVPRDTLVDIKGVLWLDRSSAELRRLEFEYTNLPQAVYELCEGKDPRDPRPDRVCQRFAEEGRNRFGIGGDADFRRLTNGEWLTFGWTIRTLSNEMNSRPSPRKVRHLYPKEKCSEKVRQFPKPGDCTYVLWKVPRLTVASTRIARLLQAGVEIYRDNSSPALVVAAARKRSGKHPAFLRGVVADGVGHPLRNAIVQTESPGRVVLTDSVGFFEIRTLPPGPIILSVRCRGYQPVRFRLPLLPDSTRHVSLGLVPDSTSGRLSSDCSNSP